MSSDEKALEEFHKKHCHKGLSDDKWYINIYELEKIEQFILKTRQEAREEECQRILGLPSMEEMKMEGYTTQDAKSYHEGRNSLRRELKEDINKKI